MSFVLLLLRPILHKFPDLQPDQSVGIDIFLLVNHSCTNFGHRCVIRGLDSRNWGLCRYWRG